MIPVKLSIKGFLSYQQLTELDFTGISLACISGENGAGKSALLDAITWALFGQARKRDESVINNHPKVEAAEVTMDFDYEGNRYRVQRSNPRGKTSVVEFFIRSQVTGDDQWKPLTERTLRETDQKIVDTLRMDYETFIHASFFLQGKADQFAVARPGERKRILSNILGLEVWETYREAAGKRRRENEKTVKELDGRLSEIQAELDEGAERKQRLAELEARLAELTAQRKARAQDLDNVQRLHTALEVQQKTIDTLKAQLTAAESSRDALKMTLAERKEEKQAYDQTLVNANSIEKAYAEWQQTRQELGAMEELAASYREHEARRQEPLQVIQAEKARLLQEKQGLQEQQSALDQLIEQKGDLETGLESAQKKNEAAKQTLARRESLEGEIRQLQADQAEAKAENPRLKQEMDQLKERIDRLAGTKGVECPLCGQPLSAGERKSLIERLTAQGTGLADRYRANKQLLENFEEQGRLLGADFADLKNADNHLRDATREADQFENQLALMAEQEKAWQKKGAERLTEIEMVLANETYALIARQQLDQISTESQALGYDLQAHEKLRQAEQSGREAEAELRSLEQARAALTPIEREIDGLESQLNSQEQAVDALSTAFQEAAAHYAADESELPDLATAEASLHDIQEQENRLRMEVGGAQQKVNVLVVLEERKSNFQEERDTLTQLIADLKQLERALGKDGVPALLIEQALPEIEETTNDLLSRLTNGRMAFSFLTQREFKDSKRDDLKETLDIVISDSLGERDYEMFSGGEAFRVNFAVRLALSQVLARRAGARLQTLVIDEGFGSQDAQGRQRLIEAINLVQDDFKKILVITHLEELKDAFPTRIEVEKTLEGSQVRVL